MHARKLMNQFTIVWEGIAQCIWLVCLYALTAQAKPFDNAATI